MTSATSTVTLGASEPDSVSEQPIVSCEQVSRVYRVGGEDLYAVRDVTIDIHPGRLVALRGRSGSGKTTLLNLMSGLDRPTSGLATIKDQNTNKLSDTALTQLRRHEIGFIFQTFSLLPVLSAYENVELPLRIAGIGARERHQRTIEVLGMVGLSKRMDHRPFELSGGEQGRVGIARALVNRPSLIVADEPTGELDSVTGLQIMLLFRRIVDSEDVTVIMATHDPTISEIADETHIMQDGELSEEIPEELQGVGIIGAQEARLPGTLFTAGQARQEADPGRRDDHDT